MGRPCIISLRTAVMYHRAGRMHEIPRSGQGILSIGKTIPDNSMVGIISSNPENISAMTCCWAMVEMSRPSERLAMM